MSDVSWLSRHLVALVPLARHAPFPISPLEPPWRPEPLNSGRNHRAALVLSDPLSPEMPYFILAALTKPTAALVTLITISSPRAPYLNTHTSRSPYLVFLTSPSSSSLILSLVLSCSMSLLISLFPTVPMLEDYD